MRSSNTLLSLACLGNIYDRSQKQICVCSLRKEITVHFCELDLLKQDAWDPRHGLHGRREQAAVSINDIFEPVSIKAILAIMMQPYWYE